MSCDVQMLVCGSDKSGSDKTAKYDRSHKRSYSSYTLKEIDSRYTRASKTNYKPNVNLLAGNQIRQAGCKKTKHHI